MHRIIVSAELFELAREAFAAAWLERNGKPDLEPGERTSAGLRAALSVLGVVVAGDDGRPT
jgi:hypothetical protein